jgi:hypothetical protein
VPIGEDIELNLGSDGLVTLEPKRMDFQRLRIKYDSNGRPTGWDIFEDWAVEIRNSQNEEIPLEISRYHRGDWEIASEEKFERVDKDHIKYKFSVPPLSTRTIRYQTTTHEGTNIRKK